MKYAITTQSGGFIEYFDTIKQIGIYTEHKKSYEIRIDGRLFAKYRTKKKCQYNMELLHQYIERVNNGEVTGRFIFEMEEIE